MTTKKQKLVYIIITIVSIFIIGAILFISIYERYDDDRYERYDDDRYERYDDDRYER